MEVSAPVQEDAPNHGIVGGRVIIPHLTGRGCWILCWRPCLRCFYTTPPPGIPLEQLASGSHRVSRRVSRQSCSRVDPVPPSIPPELLASGSRRVSRQSGSPVDPAETPARAARQWIPPRLPPERSPEYPARAARHAQWIPPSIPLSVSQSSSPADPAEYPARVARQWIPPSTPPEQPASGSRRVSR